MFGEVGQACGGMYFGDKDTILWVKRHMVRGVVGITAPCFDKVVLLVAIVVVVVGLVVVETPHIVDVLVVEEDIALIGIQGPVVC